MAVVLYGMKEGRILDVRVVNNGGNWEKVVKEMAFWLIQEGI